MKWFKIYGERWFMGSSRWELTVEQRAVWVDLLARASINDPPGQINYYSLEQLAQQFNVDLELLERAIKRCEEVKKIKHFPKKRKILIVNWKKYQSEYQRQLPYRKQDKCQSKVTKVDDKSCNKVTLRREGEEKRLEIEEKENKKDKKIEELSSLNNNSFKSPLLSNSNTFIEKQKSIKEEFLSKLENCTRYPYDEMKDSLLFEFVFVECPGINILEQLDKKVAWWKEYPDALKPTANPRKKLEKWFKQEYEFQKRGGPQQIGEILNKGKDQDHRNFIKKFIGLGVSKDKNKD